ncbi:hypothetical protein [Nocardia xishanensis]|uniref:hypothetical protein n=1 Tax=Nocardia xishanensis TaxID=238964 RepID=UPI00341E815C
MSQNSNPYPNLGFNPVPGTPTDVAGLRGQVNSAYDGVKETNQLLTRLRNSNDDVWKGDAGNAFRANFDATLAQDLGLAQASLEKAVGLIDEWHTNLVSFQETAKALESEAADARNQHTQATATLDRAQANPDLKLANVFFTDQAELQTAQTRLDAATAQVRTASTAVDEWQGKINSIIQRARDLEDTHTNLAKRIASDLETAAKAAPSAPDKSIWDTLVDGIKSIGQWIKDHKDQIHDVLAGISAVTGLIALLTPPPVSAIFGGIALIAGVGALATNFLDADVRNSFSSLMDGDWNSGDLGAAKKLLGTVGVDSLAAIPGAGGLIKGGLAAKSGGSFVAAFAEGAGGPGIVSKIADWGLTTNIPKLGTSILPGEGKVILSELGEASKYSTGTTAAGIETVSRAAKAGLGLFGIGEVMGGN